MAATVTVWNCGNPRWMLILTQYSSVFLLAVDT